MIIMAFICTVEEEVETILHDICWQKQIIKKRKTTSKHKTDE